MIAGGVVCLLGLKPFKGSGWRQFLSLVGQPPEERLTTAWTMGDQHESTKAFFLACRLQMTSISKLAKPAHGA